MDPAKPPDPRRRALSHSDAFKGPEPRSPRVPSGPAMSYADAARRNNAPKKNLGTKPAPRVAEPKSVDGSGPALATQRSPSIVERPPGIRKDTKIPEDARKSGAPKPSKAPKLAEVREREVRPRQHSPAPSSAKSEKNVKSPEPPRKNRPLTWAGVVKGLKADVKRVPSRTRPVTSHTQLSSPKTRLAIPQIGPVTPLLQPATPQLQPATAHSNNHVSPNKAGTASKEHETPARQMTKENIKAETPGRESTYSSLYSPDPTKPEARKYEPQTPGQLRKQKSNPNQTSSNGNVATTPVPAPWPDFDLPKAKPGVDINPERPHWTNPWEDRNKRLVKVTPLSNITTNLMKKQEAEIAKSREQSPYSTAWPPLKPAMPLSSPAQTNIESVKSVDAEATQNDADRGRSPTGRHRYTIDAATQTDLEGWAVKKEREKSAMRRGIDKETANLWQYQFGWDVMVKCGPMQWRVHRHILVAESGWFAKRLPPHDPVRTYVEFDCAGHQVGALGHALWFMYHGFYDGCTIPPDDHLNGDCIRKNIYMYISGASVDCRSMMDFATAAMDRITADLTSMMPNVYGDPSLHRLHVPLRQGLELLHSQGNRPNMEAMRLAVARLVDVTLLYLVKNEGFRHAFLHHWCREIYPMCFWDSLRFRRMGLIGEGMLFVAGEELTGEEWLAGVGSEEGTVVAEVESDKVLTDDDDDDATPRAEHRENMDSWLETEKAILAEGTDTEPQHSLAERGDTYATGRPETKATDAQLETEKAVPTEGKSPKSQQSSAERRDTDATRSPEIKATDTQPKTEKAVLTEVKRQKSQQSSAERQDTEAIRSPETKATNKTGLQTTEVDVESLANAQSQSSSKKKNNKTKYKNKKRKSPGKGKGEDSMEAK